MKIKPSAWQPPLIVRPLSEEVEKPDFKRWLKHARGMLDILGEEGEPMDQRLSDCVSALLHYANTNGIDFTRMLDRGLINFLSETVEPPSPPLPLVQLGQGREPEKIKTYA